MALTAFSALAKVLVTQDIETNSTLFADKSVQHGISKAIAVTTGITKAASFAQAMSGGAATIDLTALVGVNGLAVDGTGLRVQWMLVENPATNGNPITISEGASNGYDGFGASFSLTLAPGAYAVVFSADAGSDISGSKKTLDLAGTLTQALNVVLAIG